ncbi:hypothetical protein HK405_000739, partial [Cladochytrium tenue]
ESELNQYRFQLEQVGEALAKDPGNAELQKLEADLKDLIALYERLVPAPAPAASSTAPSGGHEATAPTRSGKRSGAPLRREQADNDNDDAAASAPEPALSGPPPRWVKGQTVLAKYKDGKLYEAVVEATPYETAAAAAASGESQQQQQQFYLVTFRGYSGKARVAAGDVADFDPTRAARPSAAVTGGQANRKAATPRAFAAAFGAGEDRRSKKLRRLQELQDRRREADEEHGRRQSSWQNFASGGNSRPARPAAAAAAPAAAPAAAAASTPP